MAKKLVLKIYIDDLTGEVEEVACTKRFDAEGPLFKIDVLKESKMALEHIYKYERDKFLDELVIETGQDGKIAKA